MTSLHPPVAVAGLVAGAWACSFGVRVARGCRLLGWPRADRRGMNGLFRGTCKTR